MQSCPVCETNVNVVTTGAVDTVISEAFEDVFGICVRSNFYHIKGRRVQCIKCRKEFIIIKHKKVLVPIDETPKG